MYFNGVYEYGERQIRANVTPCYGCVLFFVAVSSFLFCFSKAEAFLMETKNSHVVSLGDLGAYGAKCVYTVEKPKIATEQYLSFLSLSLEVPPPCSNRT